MTRFNVSPLNISPLVYRELRVSLRTMQPVRKRFLAAPAAVSAALFFIILSIWVSPRTLAYPLYWALMSWSLFEILMISRSIAGQLFMEERHNGTLSLLFLTGLKPAEIAAGKSAAAVLTSFWRLAAIVPCLAVPFVMGRFDTRSYAASIATIFAWFVLVLGINFAASLVFDDESAAAIFTEIVLGVLVLAVPVLDQLNQKFAGVSLPPGWLQLSPGNSLWILYTDARDFAGLYRTNAATTFIGTGFLLFGLHRLRRLWAAALDEGVRGKGRRLSRYRQRWRTQMRGLLENSPFAWLVLRDDRPALILGGSVFLVCSLWLLGLWKWSTFWLLPANIWITCLVLAGFARSSLHYISARTIAEARSGGALELMLTTDLTPKEIVDGQALALRRFARWVQRALIGVFSLLFLLGLLSRSWTIETLASYATISAGIALLVLSLEPSAILHSFWISLNTGRSAFALQKALWTQGGMIWVGIQAYLHRSYLATVPTGSFWELIVAAGVLLLAVLIRFAQRFEMWPLESSASRMREIAAHPVPDRFDRRLKGWDTKVPLIDRMVE